jgi:cytochrome P450
LLHGINYARDPLGYLTKVQRRYGDVFSLRFPDFGQLVYVAEPSLVKELFTGAPADLHAGAANATVLAPAVGPSSVLTLDGDEHMRQRKLLLAPFHGKAIEHYRDVMLAATRRDLETWPVGTPFATRKHMERITLDVILRAVFGIDDGEGMHSAHTVIHEFASSGDALVLPSFLKRSRVPPWRRFVRARHALDATVFAAIAARRAAGDWEERDDVLSLLMRTDPTDQELRDELVTVVGAGHETTATALAWTIERLVRHAPALERLQADPDDTAYLDAVIKESLRVRPIIADVARKTTRPLTLAGYEIPTGTILLAAITAVHARDDVYRDAAAFRPERWLEPDAPPETYTWIPFGGGVRRCLGAAFAQEEMRVVLREIVSRADLRAVSARDERAVMRNITIAPKDGARVVLERPLRAVRSELTVALEPA